MALKLDLLNSATAIVDKRFKPTPQFMLFWQRSAKAIESADSAQTDLLNIVLNQQVVITQLLTVVSANVAYLNQLFAWQQEVSDFTLDRVSYLQLAVAAIATQGGFTIADPGGLLPWPGDPPTPPYGP